MGVNVKGAWHCARGAVAPAMQAAAAAGDRERLVDNRSDRSAGVRPLRRLEGCHRRPDPALARELGPDGICVNTLTPDYIAFDRDYDNRQPDMAQALAAQRIFAAEQVPEDMVGTSSSSSLGPRLRLRHGAGHLGERRSHLPRGGRTGRRDLARERNEVPELSARPGWQVVAADKLDVRAAEDAAKLVGRIGSRLVRGRCVGGDHPQLEPVACLLDEL